ncbi:type I pullulanase [Gracilibacillus caseinilyticus]|uniref:Type I pullulanase n=1 Tax=Gracilibacillus caseinilyticus TaxID=2932256 RepID=A0ABY4EUE7_9BACI|nr:type I pullulanase [Gracilibacillus caseinilyticus]UOQ47264.1 type I pullulanase [Gracilibacillus caseinilyticus]
MECFQAFIDEPDVVVLEHPKTAFVSKENVKVIASSQAVTVLSIERADEYTLYLQLEEEVILGEEMYLVVEDSYIPIDPRHIVWTDWFERHYTAKAEELGPNYTAEKTTFRVWSPTATQVEVCMWNKRFPMIRKTNGVWQLEWNGDLAGVTYQYAVTINRQQQLVNDPYAKSMKANSECSVVIDLSKTDPAAFRQMPSPTVDKQDAVIYELHVRDATSAATSGVQHKGTFSGLTEKHTTTENGFSTALYYMKELGITHAQILPIQDYARVDERNPSMQYNWGYDPLFYMVPEGSYATNPDDPSARITECKKMIMAFHEQGIGVILDVVFNHVYAYEHSVLEALVPGYYFRYYQDGSISNGSGTGNDLATERVMVRKLLVETIDYWLEEFQVDGFRFDLMGLIDVETMTAISKRCQACSRPVLLLGEGWEMETAIASDKHKKASLSQASALQNISFFNDQYRDVLKGNLFDQEQKGFVNGNGLFHDRIAALIAGSADNRFGNPLFSNPLQSVNYVECHDNLTLADFLVRSNPEVSEEVRKKMHQLATGLVLLSQGVPFLHAGQEFFRTKKGNENSYNAGDDINQLDWLQRVEENDNVAWIRQLIALRKQYPHFRMVNSDKTKAYLHIIPAPLPVFAYMLIGPSEDFTIFINPTNEMKMAKLAALGRWEKIVSNHSSTSATIHCTDQLPIELAGYELAVWKKNRR